MRFVFQLGFFAIERKHLLIYWKIFVSQKGTQGWLFNKSNTGDNMWIDFTEIFFLCITLKTHKNPISQNSPLSSCSNWYDIHQSRALDLLDPMKPHGPSGPGPPRLAGLYGSYEPSGSFGLSKPSFPWSLRPFGPFWTSRPYMTFWTLEGFRIIWALWTLLTFLACVTFQIFLTK